MKDDRDKQPVGAKARRGSRSSQKEAEPRGRTRPLSYGSTPVEPGDADAIGPDDAEEPRYGPL